MLPEGWKAYTDEHRQEELEAIATIGVFVSRALVEATYDLTKGLDPAERKALCVLAAPVGEKVYHAFGFEAQQMPLEFQAVAGSDMRAFEAGKKSGDDLWFVELPDPSRDLSDPTNVHVGLLVEGALVDLTAGQATQRPYPPEHANSDVRIIAPDTLVLPLRDVDVDCQKERITYYFEDGDTYFTYFAQPDNLTYQKNGFWTAHDLISQVVEKAISDIESNTNLRRPRPKSATRPPGHATSATSPTTPVRRQPVLRQSRKI